VRDGDPEKFHKFPCVYHTMLVTHWKEYIAMQYKEIVAVEGDAVVNAVAAMPRKHTTEDLMDGTNLSLNLIHQYYHLFQWQRETGDRIADLDRIVEYGGGYGAMALVAYRAGFRGEYHIFDGPEFSLLQEFYLSRVLSEGDFSMVKWNSRVRATDLLIAAYSLSEVSVSERTKFLTKIGAMSYLLLYTKRFEDYDNKGYFTNFIGQNNPARWTVKPVAYLPDGSWYAICGASDDV
jgi:hypothetical protein